MFFKLKTIIMNDRYKVFMIHYANEVNIHPRYITIIITGAQKRRRKGNILFIGKGLLLEILVLMD